MGTPNADQIEYWNQVSGARWVAVNERLDALLSPLGTRAMDRAAPIAGERAIDVGCGCGQTSLQLAERVGASGSVVGIDLSAPMLARAAERAAQTGRDRITFVQADAQTQRFDPAADLVFSRFGVMFFDDPPAAFANLRAALVAEGRLAFVCWQELARNPWMGEPLAVVARHVELPPRPEPGTPGPFAFADASRVQAILAEAGFEGVEIEDVRQALSLGADPEAALDVLARGVGPVAGALAEATPDAREAVVRDLRELLAGRSTADGVVFEAAVWVVRARNPGP